MIDGARVERPRRRVLPRGSFVPWLVLAVGLVLTALSSIGFLRAIRERDRSRFENAVEATEDRIRARIETYETLLFAARGELADPSVRRNDFRKFVDALELPQRYPGVQGLGFAVVVPKDERSPRLDEMRSQTEVPFSLWPAGAREPRTAIVWLEPLDRRNRAAIGYDMFAEPVRHEAMARARDTGLPAASGRVTLVQEIDPDKQAGFLIYLATYAGGEVPATPEARRAALRGWVYAAFRADDMFNHVFGTERFPRIAFGVFDGTGADAASVLYRSDTASDDARYAPRFTSTTTLEVAGRPWTIVFRTRPAFEETPSEGTVALGALLGVGMSLVLFFVTRSQSRARRAAETSERRLRFLAEAGAALGGTLEIAQATAALARIVVPTFAPFCFVDLARVDGELERVEIAHDGTLPNEVVKRLEARPPQHAASPVVRAFRSGETVVERDFERTRIDAGVDPERRDALLALGAREMVSVPLVARGRTLGVVSFGRRDAFDEDDVGLAIELVRRTALAIDNARLYRESRDAVRARDVFLSIASHELKTPLTSLKLHAQRFVRNARRAEESGGAEVAERARSIDDQATRLNALVDDLLDVSRIAAGKLKFTREPVDLAALVHDVVQRFDSPLVSTSGEREVLGAWDRLRLDQVVTNLVSNALKYGDQKPVEVRVESTPTHARIVVTDQGIGIAKEHQARVFERFERFVSERHYGGFGLGLWISRQIVEGLGGTIGVGSEPGRGSTFVVELPREPPPDDGVEAIPPS